MMQRRAWRLPLLAVAVLAIGLTACSDPSDRQPAVKYSPSATASALDNMQASAGNILQGATFGLDARTMGALSSGLPAGETPNRLPRGVYVWNEATSDWLFVENSAELVLRWPELGDEEAAQLTVDWGATVDANDEAGTLHEAPQGATVDVTVGGASIGEFASSATWQNVPGCGLILEPASLDASGAIADGTSRLSLENFRLRIPLDSGTFSLSGKVSAVSGGDALSFNWALSANGTAHRDATSCFVDDVDVTSGSVDLGISANDDSLGLAFDFSDVQLDAGRNLQSVRLSGGALTVNGSVAVSFEGTLGSSGLLGDDLNLTFSNGEQMTLNAFLRSNLSAIASMALRSAFR